MNKISYKNFFIKYGIFISIITIFIVLLIYPIKAGQKAWNKQLKNNIEFVLDESEPNAWTVENPIRIKNPFSLSAVCFEARNRKNGEMYKALLIRIQSFYGPLPVVFTIDKNDHVELIGFVSVHGRIEKQTSYKKINKRLEYWKNKIPEIIK
ncbi:MAG: hypothetical protein K6C97_06745 [Treponema sp.]|nr:hypothetical protein [Treponema sp.]